MTAWFKQILRFSICITGIFPSLALALTFVVPDHGDNVVGQLQIVHARSGDNFSSLGRRYDVGYYELVEANPGIDPHHPIPGALLVIPSMFILPPGPHEGLVVNLPELRLYYFPPNSHTVVTYPVGIGREGWNTPIGTSQVVAKIADPTWYVPDSIRDFRKAEGVLLPKFVSPGPDNPLGGYELRLGFPAYLIHGTNDASGVGRRSSSGCIRMFPEDIEGLFSMVSVGTPLRNINEPYKIGWRNNRMYLEAHLPLQEQQPASGAQANTLESLVSLATHNHPEMVDWDLVQDIKQSQNGIPIAIDKRQIPLSPARLAANAQ
jgi:L,D-transpeptidase ErfK/SrfK